MAVSTKLAAITNRLLVDDLQDELMEVQDTAVAGRQYLWTAFALAYIWYRRAKGEKNVDGSDYLEQTYLSQNPAIRSKAGVSEFNRLAKLAFNMNQPRFAPTVSRYAMAFEYIHKHAPKLKRYYNGKNQKRRTAVLVTRITSVIEKIGGQYKSGGIHACAKAGTKLFKGQNSPPLSNPLQPTIDKYAKATSKGTVKGRTIGSVALGANSDAFVLLLARPLSHNSYEVVEVLDASEAQIRVLLKRNP